MKLMRAGRARWRIENEMLAFAIDQVQKMCCALFRAARAKAKREKYFREEWRKSALRARLHVPA